MARLGNVLVAVVAVLVLLLTIHGEEALVEDKTDTRRLLRTPTELSQRSLQTVSVCPTGTGWSGCEYISPCGTNHKGYSGTGCWGSRRYCCPTRAPTPQPTTSSGAVGSKNIHQ
jgi:hypothetical protein